MNIEKLRQHPFVVFGQEHYNPLGIVRTLGEKWHPSDCLCIWRRVEADFKK